MKKYYLDTNILLRFLLGDLPLQYEAAKSYFERAKKGEILLLICQAVILESEHILSKQYKLGRMEVVDVLGKIISIPYLEVEDRIAFQEALIIFSHAKADLVDCFLFFKAKQDQAEVLSFDKDLKRLAAK